MVVLRLLLTPRWLVRHVLLVVALVVCWELGGWQLGRALDRDSVLNWSYALEWFLFGAFAVLTWGWFLRDDLRGPEEDDPREARPPVAARPAPPPVTDDEDPELAAYNRMLAALHQKESS